MELYRNIVAAMLLACASNGFAADKNKACPSESVEQQSERALQLLKSLRAKIAADPTLSLRQDAQVHLDAGQLQVCTTVCEHPSIVSSRSEAHCSTKCIE